MATHNFKVLIAGGSIAGLVLANILEQLGVDFLVLEAYPEIAPQVGASIGFFPNGCRILDQIGCYDDIQAKLDESLSDMYFKSEQGISLSSVEQGAKHFIARSVLSTAGSVSSILTELPPQARLRVDLH